jgi:uncharacterized membrane protein YfcA
MDGLYELLVGDLAPWQFAFVLLAAFATGAFHTLSGFGGGLVLSIIIAPVIGVEAVVPVMALALIISAISRVWVFRKEIDHPTLATIMIPALPGIVSGAVLYGYMPPWLISIVLGIFLLFVVAIRRPLQKRGIRVGTLGLGAVGALFGLLSGATIGGGMVLAPFLIGRGLVKERLAALFAAVGLILNLTKTSVFLSTAQLDLHLTLLGVALGLSTIPGTYLGYGILRRTSVRVHTGFVEALVLAAGVGFVWFGVNP